jgi:hypothetical protein
MVSLAPAGVTMVYTGQPNVDLDPTKPFIRFTLGPIDTERESFGGSGSRERAFGRVYIDVFVPRQTGDSLLLDLADQCAAAFRNWQWRSGDAGIDCDTPSTSITEEPDWLRAKVSVKWQSVRTV